MINFHANFLHHFDLTLSFQAHWVDINFFFWPCKFGPKSLSWHLPNTRIHAPKFYLLWVSLRSTFRATQIQPPKRSFGIRANEHRLSNSHSREDLSLFVHKIKRLPNVPQNAYGWTSLLFIMWHVRGPDPYLQRAALCIYKPSLPSKQLRAPHSFCSLSYAFLAVTVVPKQQTVLLILRSN